MHRSARTTTRRSALALLGGLAAAALPAADAGAQTRDPGFTIEQILSPAFPYNLVSARRADRIAWIENDRGMRNVFTAAGPDFRPVRLTSTLTDDGVDLGQIALSDDGSVVLFVRGHGPNMEGMIANPPSDPLGGRREIWAASTGGGRAPWRVVALEGEPGGGGGGGGGGAGGMVLSPDGRWVLYTGGGKIYRAEVDPGITAASVLDDAPPLFRDFGVHSNPVWSPDGKKIAFVSSRYDERRPFPLQGRAPTHSFVTIYDVDARRITYMAPGVDFDSSPTWSADGTRLAFIRKPGAPFGAFATAPRGLPMDQIPAGFLEAKFRGGYTLSFWVADVATGAAREVWHNAPGDSLFAEVGTIRWAGDHLLFNAEVNDWDHWYTVPVAGANPTVAAAELTPGEGEVEHVTFSPDGRWLYYAANIGDLDRSDLFRVPTGGGRVEQLTRGSGFEVYPVIMGSGNQLGLLQSGARQPLSIGVMAATGGEPRTIGPRLPSDFPTAKHVEPQTVLITSADGVEAHSLLFLPADLKPGEKRPTLLFIHGGPGMRTVLGYHYEGSHGFYHQIYSMTQYFVNKGYIVMSVNYRAGTGYGRAFRLAPERRDQGNSEYRDVLAAGLYLKNRPDVDAERLGVWGLSYGGWLTGQALSRNSDVFKSGMIFAGVQMRSATLDPQNLAYQSSPAYNIEKWTSPVLVVHGDDDRNVEFSQTVGLVQLLRAHDVDHELIVFPNDTHYYQIFSRWLTTYRAIDDWFDRTLIRRPGATSEGNRQR